MTTFTSSERKPHVLPLKVYLIVGVTLLLLTAVTVAAAQMDLGPFNLVVAMCIAALKATLVALFFMHLLFDNKFYAVLFVAALLFLGIFIIFTMFDTLRRADIYEQVGKPIKERAVIYDQNRAESSSGPTH